MIPFPLMDSPTVLFFLFGRDHLQSTSEIICGSGSFEVQFGDPFRSGDHLRSGSFAALYSVALTMFAPEVFFVLGSSV